MFQELGLEDAVVPGTLPDGTYKAFVYEAKPGSNKAGKPYLILTYKVNDPGGVFHEATIDEWKSASRDDDAKTKGYLKQRLSSLGVPDSRMGSLTPQDLVGTEVLITVKNKDNYCNVVKVALVDGANPSDSWNPLSIQGESALSQL